MPLYMTYDHIMKIEVQRLVPVPRVIVRSCLERIASLRFKNGHLEADKKACFWRFKLDWFTDDNFTLVVWYPIAKPKEMFRVYPEKYDTRDALSVDFMCDLDWFDTRDILIYPKSEMMCAAFYMVPDRQMAFADEPLESCSLF